MYQYPDYLMHYGVPGMKWGQRRRSKYLNKKLNSAKSSVRESSSRAQLAKEALRRNDPEELRQVHIPSNKPDINLSRKVLNQEIKYSDAVRKQFESNEKRLNKIPIDKMNTRQFKKEVNAILNDTSVFDSNYKPDKRLGW